MKLVAIVCASVVSAASAQTAGQRSATPNIAVINLGAVFERFQMTRDLEQVFTDQRESLATQAQKTREDVIIQRNALAQFKPGSPDFLQREEELVFAQKRFEGWLDIQEVRLKREHKTWLELIYRNVQDAVAKIAEGRGIDLVLTYSDLEEDAPDSIAFKQQILLRTVIYAHDRIDLTEEVIRTVDGDYAKRGGINAIQAGGSVLGAQGKGAKN